MATTTRVTRENEVQSAAHAIWETHFSDNPYGGQDVVYLTHTEAKRYLPRLFRDNGKDVVAYHGCGGGFNVYGLTVEAQRDIAALALSLEP